MSEITVTPEMRAAGWAQVNRDLIDGFDWALDDLYRAMRALEPVSIPYRPRNRVPAVSEDPD